MLGPDKILIENDDVSKELKLKKKVSFGGSTIKIEK